MPGRKIEWMASKFLQDGQLYLNSDMTVKCNNFFIKAPFVVIFKVFFKQIPRKICIICCNYVNILRNEGLHVVFGECIWSPA